MSGTRTKRGILLAAIAWILIAAVIAVGYRFIIAPHFRGKLIQATGSGNNINYKHTIAFGIDGFSGYAPIRSDQLKKELDAQGIKLDFRDDKAKFLDRLKDLRDGKLQMAVFTIDSLISTSITLKDIPATIVQVIDESKGADAVVGYKQAVNNLQDLNAANATFVLTPDSPSEFLARTLSASFNLASMSTSIEREESSEAVLRRMRKADRSQKTAYVLWQPQVTQALNDENVHIIFDSSKLTGHILDVIVVERQFLKDNPSVVKAVVESVSRVNHYYGKQPDGLLNLVLEDAKKQGSALTRHQAESIINGLIWKNTLENYAHFGIVSGAEGGNLPTLDKIIRNIVSVLVSTGAADESNVITGREKTLYYDGVLRSMQTSKFHPGAAQSNIIEAAAGNIQLDSVRALAQLRALTDDEWKTLKMVGEFRIEPITFGRGKSTLNSQAQRDLSEIANRLQNFPNYYLVIVGNARSDGDVEIALQLATDRSKAVADYLTKTGVHENRIKSIAAKPSGSSGDAQTVNFVVGQLPY